MMASPAFFLPEESACGALARNVQPIYCRVSYPLHSSFPNPHSPRIILRISAHLPSLPPLAAQGRSYLCKRLDLERRLAVVRPVKLKYYTKTADHTDVDVVASHRAAFRAPVRSLYFRWIIG